MEHIRYDAESPGEHLACDEMLLRQAEAGDAGESLRFYEVATYAVVLGIAGWHAVETHGDKCRRDGVPLFRRHSGGGTVLLGWGCLAYSAVLDTNRRPVLGASPRKAYRWILSRVADAFCARGLHVRPAGISDLALDDKKVGGSAQQRRRRFILHHGTLLYDFDIPRMEKYLRPPPKEPAYRRQRAHTSFVTNIPATPSLLREALVEAFSAPFEPSPVKRALHAAILDLARRKYASDEWTYRR